MGFFSNPEKADRNLTRRMLADVAVDLKNGKKDEFTTTVYQALSATANAEGLAYDCGDEDAYPPPGHDYPRR